jgi:acyl dehydratase
MMAYGTGDSIGYSDWLTIDQNMIRNFGTVTLDPDPMHMDPEWAKTHGEFGGSIAFGFLTMSLLTYLLYSAAGQTPYAEAGQNGHYFNYGFNRLRLISPVRAGVRIRAHFAVNERTRDQKGRWRVVYDCRIDIEGEERPAMVCEWISMWSPPTDG